MEEPKEKEHPCERAIAHLAGMSDFVGRMDSARRALNEEIKKLEFGLALASGIDVDPNGLSFVRGRLEGLRMGLSAMGGATDLEKPLQPLQPSDAAQGASLAAPSDGDSVADGVNPSRPGEALLDPLSGESDEAAPSEAGAGEDEDFFAD